MDNYTIYKFTFSDGKVYIGQTSQPVEKRWQQGEGYKQQAVYVPIVLDGWNNVKKEILHTGLTSEQADRLEQYYIKKFDACKNGYNRTEGGKPKKKIFNFEHALLRDQLRTQLLEKMSQYDKNAETRILLLDEVYTLPKDLNVIEQSEDYIYETTIGKQKNLSEVWDGTGNYLMNYLSSWRLWIGEPTVRQVLNTPWLSLEDVIEYNATFIINPKVQKYYMKEHDFPATYTPGFKKYYNLGR